MRNKSDLIRNRFFSLFSLLLIAVIDGILVKGPEDVLVVRGSNVTLQCVTNRSEPVQWEVYKEPPVYWRLIYTGYPSIIPRYLRHKFDITIDSTQNEYNLTIKNIQDEDAGTYRCIDYYGLAPKEEDRMAEVIVVGNELSCSESICQKNHNQSDCVVKEMIDVNCSLKYSGKRTPTLLWSVIAKESAKKEGKLFEPQAYSTLNTGEWRSSAITSRVIINSTFLSHRSYIKCYLTDTDSHNKTFNVDRIRLSKVYWTADLIHKSDINGKDHPLNFDSKLIVIFSLTSLVFIIIFIIIYLVNSIRNSGQDRHMQSQRDSTAKLIKRAEGDKSPPGSERKARARLRARATSMEVTRLNGWIVGIAIVDEMIYVLQGLESSVSGGTVNIFDRNTLQEQDPISIAGLKSPRGLAGCSQEKALYISDDELHCIHRISLLEKCCSKWNLKEKLRPWGLSVTPDHNILLTSCDIKSSLSEYKCNGKLFRKKIKLNETIKYAWHAVKLPNGSFVVCHGQSANTEHRVCLVDAKGAIMKSYSKDAGRGGQLNEPSSVVALTNEDGTVKNIYVADLCNYRVLELDSNLTFVNQIYKSPNNKSLTCLCYDSSADRLIVSDYKGRLIYINIGSNQEKSTDTVKLNAIAEETVLTVSPSDNRRIFQQQFSSSSLQCDEFA